MARPKPNRSSAGPEGALPLLGLASRAGAVVAGIDRVRAAVRRGQARVVLLATDVAPGQRSKVDRLARVRGVPLRWGGERRELGHAIGRGPTSAVGVIQDDFAQELERRLPSVEAEEGGGSNGRR